MEIYKVADRILDKIKSEQSEIQSKLFWRKDSRRLYEHAIEACYQNNNITDAFYFLEKSRSVLLNDQLNELRYLNDDDILLQTQLKKKIAELEKESEIPFLSASRNSEIQNSLFLVRQELDQVLHFLKTRNPLFYYTFLDTTSATLEQLKKGVLNDHSAVIELFAGDSAVYIIIITTNKTHFSKIGKESFDSVINLYTSYLADVSLLNRYFDKFINTAHNLHRLLFNQISLPAGRIIISLDGKYFPFEALVSRARDQAVRYLIDDNSVSYTYSVRYLMSQLKTTGAVASSDFLGIAPVNFPGSFDVAGLNQSDGSLRRLAKHFERADMFVLTNATKRNFLQHFYKYKIIQLYTHATTGKGSGEPVIYFSDTLLYLSELLPAKKPLIDLIVLSACETGVGNLYVGEGVFSFGRGFAACGIPASVSNLWAVDNQSTYLLTELFYNFLLKECLPMLRCKKRSLRFRRMLQGKRDYLTFGLPQSYLATPNQLILRSPLTCR